MTLGEAVLIASDIVESAYTYDNRMVDGTKEYDENYTRMVDGLPTDVRLAKGQAGEIGAICRNYAVDFENVLEAIRDMSGASWATRVHVDSIRSPQQRHAWNVIFEDVPGRTLMAVGDVTFPIQNYPRKKRSPARVSPGVRGRLPPN